MERKVQNLNCTKINWEIEIYYFENWDNIPNGLNVNFFRISCCERQDRNNGLKYWERNNSFTNFLVILNWLRLEMPNAVNGTAEAEGWLRLNWAAVSFKIHRRKSWIFDFDTDLLQADKTTPHRIEKKRWHHFRIDVASLCSNGESKQKTNDSSHWLCTMDIHEFIPFFFILKNSSTAKLGFSTNLGRNKMIQLNKW